MLSFWPVRRAAGEIIVKQDRYLICTSCTTQFVWTPAEQQRDGQPPDCCPVCQRLLPAAGRRRGLVKFYNVRKNWGFITQPDGGEVFFHRSALAADEALPLHEGELMEYAVEASPRGPQAVDLRRLARSGDRPEQ
jgi:CspA family cold shock protein